MKEKPKCDGDCFNCKLPVEKCRGMSRNRHAAYKPSRRSVKSAKYGKVHSASQQIRPASYKPPSY